MGLRAAVVGGSGFGRFHAQWYALEGVEVVAYSCTSEAAARAAEGPMRQLTGAAPRGYADYRAMLDAETPDLVSICTPPSDHVNPTLSALEAGAHVLCEKPLVFDPNAVSPESLEAADRMISRAHEAGKLLAVNLQYAAVLAPYFELYTRRFGAPEAIHSYDFDMESKGNRQGIHHGGRLWIELGPHALTPLLIRSPLGAPIESRLQATVSEEEVRVTMEWEEPGGHRFEVRLRTGACSKDAIPLRRFGFNQFRVDLLSRRGEDGLFHTYLRPEASEEETVAEDLMRISIRQFIRAARGLEPPLVTGEAARRNLEWMLKIHDRLHHL